LLAKFKKCGSGGRVRIGKGNQAPCILCQALCFPDGCGKGCLIVPEGFVPPKSSLFNEQRPEASRIATDLNAPGYMVPLLAATALDMALPCT
jgi:hypothetical protein